MTASRVLVYLLRRDLRLADNPVFSEISQLARQPQKQFTHLLPIYVISAQQIEVSGFLSSPDSRSPYPQARSQVGGFWRCGPQRARFLAESIWDLKTQLERLGSGLEIRVGLIGEVIQGLLDDLRGQDHEVAGIWMTNEEGVEEEREERDACRIAMSQSLEFRLFVDGKYYIDDRDLPFRKPTDLPDVFTSFRKMVEPLRDAPRQVLHKPASLLPVPPQAKIPGQAAPFRIPGSLEGLISALLRPLDKDMGLKVPPTWPEGVSSAHPFTGGETAGHDRLQHLVSSGAMSQYKDTRNGLLGEDFSTKLSAWLALGCITARQIHAYLVDFEQGLNDLGRESPGHGKGENKGTAAVRFELLWRDYMRLCARKFGTDLFRAEGFRKDKSHSWSYPDRDPETKVKLERFLEGRTGIGLIDASQRELFLTGYTSNRARQNVASFLAKHLGIDWRFGAEWYESLLVDYDVSSNWGNWQYTAGVGNDPRGEARVFNPVKQAFDYDPKGAYIQAWVPEIRSLKEPEQIFQAWKVPEDKRVELGLDDLESVRNPLKKIEFRAGSGRGVHRGHRGVGRRGHGAGRGKESKYSRGLR